LSLNPNAAPSRAAPAPAPAAAPARTAAVAPQAPAAASTGGSGSYVQVSSQRSEGEAQAAFRSLQAKFPDHLGGRQPSIHKADLGAKGTYYRAMVGPFANAGEASQLCSSLKAAGGQCLVQRN
jgi:cell division protein FtsN